MSASKKKTNKQKKNNTNQKNKEIKNIVENSNDKVISEKKEIDSKESLNKENSDKSTRNNLENAENIKEKEDIKISKNQENNISSKNTNLQNKNSKEENKNVKKVNRNIKKNNNKKIELKEENKDINKKQDNKSENKDNIKNDDNLEKQKTNKKENNGEKVKKSNNENIEKPKNLDKENKNEKKAENVQSKTEVNKLEDKPEYVQQMLKNKKKKTIIFICSVVLFLMIIAFSTFFALFNLNSVKITKGVKIKNIDVSNLTLEEARNKLNLTFEKELIPDLNLKYNDEYNITLAPEQIEFKYNVEKALKEAYAIGRSENLIYNNYTLLFTTLLGKNIDIEYYSNEEFLNSFVDDVNSKLPGLVVEPSYYIEDNKLIIEKGIDGIQIDKEKFKKDILKTIDSRNLEDVSKENYSQTIEIPIQKAKASKIDMDKIYSEVHTEPQDAYYELEPYRIYPDVDGIDLQVSLEEAKKIINEEDKQEYQFDLKISKASKTINDLGTEAFPYIISSFTTRYDASNVNRSTNLRIAAEKINGKVLMPGEIFSFNKIVGKRTVEEGYKDAKIYADGGVVDGLAGGICQISSTLYNAVLLADLEIVERRNHSYTTSYVAAGRDATVVWGTTDFQFKNSRSFPIKIEASVKNGIAEFKFHGMQEETEYEISLLPKTTASIPFGTSFVQDATLLPGQQIVTQAGHLGYKVTTYKIKKLNGVEVSREVITNDTYQPMKTIIRTGPTAPAVPVQ